MALDADPSCLRARCETFAGNCATVRSRATAARLLVAWDDILRRHDGKAPQLA